MDYAGAVAALYQASHGEFVVERKRLAAELKTAGDKDGAKALAKLGRPPISAWAVNQLYWHARDAFDRVMATAAQLRDGDLSASPAHREALGRLRQRAATILTEAGHAATEATLRRTAQTLAALAALGSFAPDPPGALSGDRDPPGFDAAGIIAAAPPPMLSVAPRPAPEPAPDDEEDEEEDEDPDISAEEREAAGELLRAAATAKPRLTSVPASVRPPDDVKRPRHLSSVPPSAAARDDDDDDERRIAAVRQAAAAAAEKAERARLEEKKRIARERDRLATALRTARGEVESRKRDAERVRGELARAEAAVTDAAAIVADLERALTELD